MARPALASPDVTIIITTRNRAAYLPDVLARLMVQEMPDAFAREVLIVDNGSTDDTRRVVQEQRRAVSLSIRYTYEPRVGRPYALNTGMAEAEGSIFAFTDDDTLPTPTWLHALWACLSEEGADAVAGKVLPHWMAPRPPWLTDEALRAIGRLGCLDHGPHRRRTSARQDCRWFTSNLALRRESVRTLGGWDERLPYYQDTEFYHRAVRAGLNIVYEPAAVVYHKIGPERLTLAYFRQRRRLGAAYRARQVGWRREHLLTIVPLAWYGRVGRSALAWMSCALRGAPWWQRFQHELFLREAVGTWCYRLRRWPRWCLSALSGRPFAP